MACEYLYLNVAAQLERYNQFIFKTYISPFLERIKSAGQLLRQQMDEKADTVGLPYFYFI
jgi:hypothetical protein